MPNPLIAAAIPSIIEAGKGIISNLFPDPKQKIQAEFELHKLAHSAQMGQLEINKVEAAHRSFWVAGARPFILWGCGVALLYNFVVRDLLIYGLLLAGHDVPPPPSLDLTDLWLVLGGLLGLGGMRSLEKIRGVAR